MPILHMEFDWALKKKNVRQVAFPVFWLGKCKRGGGLRRNLSHCPAVAGNLELHCMCTRHRGDPDGMGRIA